MTKQETINIISIIVMSYPTSEKYSEDTITGMVGVWSKIFSGDEYKLVELAVQKHICTNKWMPSIAEIREQMAKITHPEIVSPDIAWTLVSDILQIEGEYGNYEYDLPELIKKAMTTIGWRKMYRLQKSGQDKQFFMELYKPMYERALETAMLPKTMRTALDSGNDVKRVCVFIRDKRNKKQDEERAQLYGRYANIRRIAGVANA